MSLKTKGVFYLNDRYRTLVDNREEIVAGIRRTGWRIVGLLILMYAVAVILIFLFIRSRDQLLAAEGFPSLIAVWTIFMLASLLWTGVSYRKRAQLFAEGEIVKGTIDTIKIRKNQRRDEATIKYHFQTLTGEMLSGKQVCWLDNTDGKRPPEAGTTVAVLYRTNKHHLIL